MGEGKCISVCEIKKLLNTSLTINCPFINIITGCMDLVECQLTCKTMGQTCKAISHQLYNSSNEENVCSVNQNSFCEIHIHIFVP